MSINGKNLRLELHRNAYTDEVIIDMANEIAAASNSTVKNVDVSSKKIEILTTNSNKDQVTSATESSILNVINNLGESSIEDEDALMEMEAIKASKSVINMYNIILNLVQNKAILIYNHFPILIWQYVFFIKKGITLWHIL